MMQLLKQLCQIHAPSGNESNMTNFLLNYIEKEKKNWRHEPVIYAGDKLQDCIILKFGNPRTAVFAHVDSIGFTVRYENQLVPIGGPEIQKGDILTGKDSNGIIECTIDVDDENRVFYNFGRPIRTGTDLVFKCDFVETNEFVQSCYLDNRLGVYNALKLAETLKNGVIVFSTYEEHGGGSVPFLLKFIVEEFGIHQALISDITWTTDGVQHGNGVAISLRDKNIPRKKYLDSILEIAERSAIPYQLEVEGNGSSDGREIQYSPYAMDWCFIGAPESNVHTPKEKVFKSDINSMLAMYSTLMEQL
jgi:putative aminopeptidase FrvX